MKFEGGVRLLFVSIVLIIGTWLAYTYQNDLKSVDFRVWLDGLGSMGWGLFILLYAFSVVFFLPGVIMTLVGGAFFGIWIGMLVNLLGATLGACISFLIARFVMEDRLKKTSPSRIQHAIESEGWRFVVFSRLIPFAPFFLLNYAFGLSGVSFVHFLSATFFGVIPGVFVYTYIGYAGREVIDGSGELLEMGLLGFGLLALLFLPVLIRRVRGYPNMSAR